MALIPLLGHSRGHTGIAVNSGDGWLLHCGDAYFNRGQVETPPSCPPVLTVFQRLLASDQAARAANTERLRELAARTATRSPSSAPTTRTSSSASSGGAVAATGVSAPVQPRAALGALGRAGRALAP